MKFFNDIGEWFRLSRTETNGYFLLALLTLAIILVPFVYSQFEEKWVVFTEEDQARMDSLIKVIENRGDDVSPKEKSEFDPNDAGLEHLKDLGIPSHIAQRIINYRTKGGKFRKREDLARIYGMDSALFSALYDYIKIKDVGKTANQRMDINRIEIEDIGQLGVVNERLASRLVSYRSKLGGYTNMGQIHEVYGMDSISKTVLADRLFIRPNFVPEKININQADYERLSEHPYINDQFAAAIVRYRNLNGGITGIEELTHFRSVDRYQIDKLFPYLEF